MTFWYMKKIGEVIYSKSVPKDWKEMTPAEAGRNAAKMMLYYAILRCRTMWEEQRAIALYNSYGYGYAIGMNYKNAAGKREMLCPQDMDEILSAGKTKNAGWSKGGWEPGSKRWRQAGGDASTCRSSSGPPRGWPSSIPYAAWTPCNSLQP